MIVMMIAMTPSLKASSRFFVIEPSPDARQQAIANTTGIRPPSCVEGEYSFFRADAIDQGCPSGHDHESSAGVPFLKVVADVSKQVGQIHRMAHERIRTLVGETSESGPDAEPPAQGDERSRAQKCSDRNQNEAALGPCDLTWHPTKIDDLRIRVGIGDDDGDARPQ